MQQDPRFIRVEEAQRALQEGPSACNLIRPESILPVVSNTPMQLILATRNVHKVEEIRSILANRFECRTLQDLPGAPDLVEDADTFEGNATSKAVTLACWLGTQERFGDRAFVLADDSGLEVDALGGAPGVHSARFAALDDPSAAPGKNSPDAQNNAKLLRLLEKVPLQQRTARFHCVLALVPIEFPNHESAEDLT